MDCLGTFLTQTGLGLAPTKHSALRLILIDKPCVKSDQLSFMRQCSATYIIVWGREIEGKYVFDWILIGEFSQKNVSISPRESSTTTSS